MCKPYRLGSHHVLASYVHIPQNTRGYVLCPYTPHDPSLRLSLSISHRLFFFLSLTFFINTTITLQSSHHHHHLLLPTLISPTIHPFSPLISNSKWPLENHRNYLKQPSLSRFSRDAQAWARNTAMMMTASHLTCQKVTLLCMSVKTGVDTLFQSHS